LGGGGLNECRDKREKTGQIPEGGRTTRTVSLGTVFLEGSSLVVTSGRAPDGRTVQEGRSERRGRIVATADGEWEGVRQRGQEGMTESE